MNVLFYAPAWPLSHFSNGIISYVDRLRPALAQEGVRSEVIVSQVGPGYSGDVQTLVALSGPWAPVVSLGNKIAYRLAPDAAIDWTFRAHLRLAGRRLRRESAIDLVEMEETFGIAPSLARSVGAPLVVRLHGPAFLTRTAAGEIVNSRLARQIRREGEAIKFAKGVSAPSREVLDRVVGQYGTLGQPSAVIPNPGPMPVESHRWTAAGAQSGRILFIGRFDRLKGADTAVEAFRMLLESHPHARLTFVGQDVGLVDDSGRSWSAESYFADRLGPNRGKLEYLGRQPNESLVELRQRAQVVIQPSRYEVFSVAALECCAQGVPLILSNTGGLAEIVRDGLTGCLVRPADPEDLAQRLRFLLDHPQAAAAMGDAALSDYRQRFTPSIVARRTKAFYEEVLAQSKSV